MTNITELRQKIDQIDKQIQNLIELRFMIVEDICKEKSKNQLQTQDKGREKEILDNIEQSYIQEIFKTILEQSRKYQDKKS
jgi:chorismate mutase